MTENDYRSLVLNEYGDADDVFVYGGEELNPPEYGRVFVAVKPKTTTALTEEEKSDIKNNILKPKILLVYFLRSLIQNILMSCFLLNRDMMKR